MGLYQGTELLLSKAKHRVKGWLTRRGKYMETTQEVNIQTIPKIQQISSKLNKQKPKCTKYLNRPFSKKKKIEKRHSHDW